MAVGQGGTVATAQHPDCNLTTGTRCVLGLFTISCSDLPGVRDRVESALKKDGFLEQLAQLLPWRSSSPNLACLPAVVGSPAGDADLVQAKNEMFKVLDSLLMDAEVRQPSSLDVAVRHYSRINSGSGDLSPF